MDQHRKRQNSNQVLFHFDSLVDLHLAVVYALQKDYPSGGLNPCINYSFLHQSKQDLKQERVFGFGKNVVQECFKGSLRDSYQTVYQSYIEEQFDTTIGLAPLTLMLRLIAGFSRAGKGLVTSTVVCSNDKQASVAKKLIKTLPAKIIVGEDKVEINDYARVILGDVRDIDLFKRPQCVHITVLNYGSNLQVVGDQPVILPEYVLKYGDVNEFQIIDSYTDVVVPDHMKKEN